MNQLRICCQLPQVVGSEEITGAVRRESSPCAAFEPGAVGTDSAMLSAMITTRSHENLDIMGKLH